MSSGTNGTISKQTFECFVCKKQGFSNERVYLDGRDENGKTIYIAEDGVTPHNHRRKEGGTLSSPNGTTAVTQAQPSKEDIIIQLMQDLSSKLDVLINDRQRQRQG